MVNQYTKKALKALQKMDHKTCETVLNAIRKLPEGDVKELKGFSDGRCRLLVGKYRVIFRCAKLKEILLIMDIGSRGDIYKGGLQ